MDNLVCKFCSLPVSDLDYYCANCGKMIKEKPVSMSFWAILWLFVLSIFLPPFGLGQTIKYIKSSNINSRILGIISLVVTILAIIITTKLAMNYFDNVTKEMNRQLQDFQIYNNH